MTAEARSDDEIIAAIQSVTTSPFDGAVMSNGRYAEGFKAGEQVAFDRITAAIRDKDSAIARVKASALHRAAEAFEEHQRDVARRERRLAPFTEACDWLHAEADRIEARP